MTLKVLSVLCYIAAGFFFYSTCLIAFVHIPNTAANLWIGGVFLTPALILLGIGMACSPDRHWKRDAGVVLASSAGFSAFVVLTLGCMFMEPEIRKLVPPRQIEFFSNHVTGMAWLGLLGVVGGILLYAARKE